MLKNIRAISTFIIASFALASANAQSKTSSFTFYSENVKDSFHIYITSPGDHGPSTKYDDVIYYMDAELKSGKHIRSLVENNEVRSKKKILYVGVGHIGNYHQLRRRDFILPFITNGDTVPKSKDYGHCAAFHRFLSSELVPLIEQRYPRNGTRTIIGHSLGGLFVVYSLFRNEGLFDRYISLSPSLWIDNYSIFSFNKIEKTPSKQSYFFIAAGSREQFNYILTGMDKMKMFMQEKKYGNLDFEWKIYPGTHNSYIKNHLQQVLQDEVIGQ